MKCCLGHKVKYFKINSEIIYRMLGSCFHNCGRQYFPPSLCSTSEGCEHMHGCPCSWAPPFPWLFIVWVSRPKGQKTVGKSRELFLFQKCRRRRIDINNIREQFWFSAFYKYFHQDQGKRNVENHSSVEIKQEVEAMTWKSFAAVSLCSCLHELHGSGLDSAFVTTYRLHIFFNIPDV